MSAARRGYGRGRTSRPPAESHDDEPREVRDPVPEANAYEMARTIVLRRLDAAPRTRAELRKTLASKLVPEDAAEAVLDRMEEVGLVDDVAYANAWVTSRQSGRGLARRALSQELRRKGIDDEIARDALAQVDSEDERLAAEELVARKLRSVREIPSDRTERDRIVRRLVGMLARKGYPPGMAMSVVLEALDAELDEAQVLD